MTQIQAIGQDAASPVSRFIALLYGVAAYVAFFVTILYAIGFVSGLVVPKTIDTGTVVPIAEALIINLLLMSVFAVQHSVMARKQFKQWWTQFVPKSVERSTFVLFSSLALMLLFWQWRPIPTEVWHIDNPQVAAAVTGLSFVGWVIVFTSTFLINHFELFGVHQVANNLTGRQMPAPRFRTPLYYKFVRHPIYRLHHRVLGRADHDGRSPAVRDSDHGLHLCRHPVGRARPDRALWRRLSPL